ncbi:MAG: Clp protease N-terminal domain-containing protein [Streptosporangiaceae bacterium]
MFERFTDQSHRAVVLAQEEARRLSHDHVGTEHLLAGLLREERGSAAKVLGSSGVTLDAVRGQIAALTGPGQEPPREHIAFTARAKKGFELALREATRFGQQIGTGHLLLGLTGQADCMAAQVLGALGTDLVALRAQVMAETSSRPEGQEYSSLLRPRMRPRRVAISDPVQALLDSIDDRLSAIERHLGMSSGGPENVIPPS